MSSTTKTAKPRKWHLSHFPVKQVQAKLREAIQSVIDVDEFKAQRQLEQDDAANIEAHRQVVHDVIKGQT